MPKFSRAAAWSVVFLALLLITDSCSSKPAAKAYNLDGRVVAVDKAHHSVMIDMKAIPDYMEAMTMAYEIPDKSSLDALKAGDYIEATLRVSDQKSWLENVRTLPADPANK